MPPSSLVITGTVTSAPSASPQPDGSNLGLKVGLPVGLVGGLALLLVLAYILWKRYSRSGGRAEKDQIINSEPGLFIGASNDRTKHY